MYYLTLSRDYVTHWSIEDAVRELCQNAIDHDPEGKLHYHLEEDEGYLEIKTKGVQLHQSALLLGKSDKEEGDDNCGMWGEGFKLALLILIRAGLNVIVENGSVVWVPKFVFNETFGCDMLVIEESHFNGDPEGLSFKISGFTNTEGENFRNRTLQMQEGYPYIKTKFGEVLTDTHHKGMLFVGGLFVCSDSSFKYGYNFNPDVLPLNRDRQTLPNWDLKTTTKSMLEEALTPEKFVEEVKAATEDVDYARYYTPADEVCNHAHKDFVEEYGDVPIADDTEQLNRMIKEGYSNSVIISNSTLSSIVKRSSTYAPKKVGKPVTALSKFQEVVKEYNSALMDITTTPDLDAYEKAVVILGFIEEVRRVLKDV